MKPVPSKVPGRFYRIVKQRRRVGKPYWLQFGWTSVQLYDSSKPCWITELEEDYATLAEAKEALAQRTR